MTHLLSRAALLLALSIFVFAPATSVSFAQDAAETSEQKDDDHDAKEGEHSDDDAAHKDDHDAADHKNDADGGDHKDDHEHAGSDSGHGSGGHDGHDQPPLLSVNVGSAVCNIAIFLGVLVILSKFVWPPILGGLKAREDKISSDLEGAEKANQEAQGLLTEYQSKLDDAAAQVQSMLAEARRDAEAAGAKIVEEAKAEAQRQSERAIADIETAKKVALSDIAGQTSSMAINVAKQVVGRELKESDHADLIRQSLDRLPSNN